MRKRWIIFPVLAGILLVAGLAWWGYGAARDRQQLLTYLGNKNQQSFFELAGHVKNMEVMLSKGIVSNSPRQRMMIFADIWQQAYAAQTNLSRLPVAGPSMTRTSKFLTQTGDFAWSLAKKYVRGQSLSRSDLEKLNRLHSEAGYLSAELLEIEQSALDGRLTWAELKNAGDRRLRSQPAPTLVGLEKLEKNMQEFPTLIYDGPFSDHILTRKPRGLTGGQITADRAVDIARSFAEAGSAQKYKVVKTDNVNGTIPAFRVHLAPQGSTGPAVTVDVSKKGGHVLFMLNARPVNRAVIPRTRAVSVAAGFLAGRGLKKMEPTYVIEKHNTGIVIFEYKQEGVIVYPDLMKVMVALDNGEVVGFEAAGFVMNHCDRKIPKPKVTEQQALAVVNPQLKITSKRLAIIPLEGLKEVLAYEFRGDLRGDTFIVYVNALTGEEERILKVIDTNSGPVTM